MSLSVHITPVTSLEPISMTALLDSGATGMFINRDFVQKNRLETTPLPQPIPVHNVDGTLNEHSSITEEIEVILLHGEHSERAHLAATNLG